MTEIQWELGPIAPLRVGDTVVIVDNLERDKEDPEGFMYHLFPLGSKAKVMRIKDYGLALLNNGQLEGWVFFEHFEKEAT